MIRKPKIGELVTMVTIAIGTGLRTYVMPYCYTKNGVRS